ncbi:hypothetical protein MMC29_000019 [Sticta canariensis]|nr:hypothetical protein [Sticta canariensis]
MRAEEVYLKSLSSILADPKQRAGQAPNEIASGKPIFQDGQANRSLMLTRAQVYLYGGVVLSWTQPSGDEVLYTRPDAVFDKSKPISGGMPHCFPQFGPGKIQQHGFARNCDWRIASTSADPQPDDRDPEVEIVLTDNDFTRSMWPHAFKAAYSVSLHGEALRTELRVINTGEQAFDFTTAVHSYLEVLHISKAKVRGLQGLKYLDKVRSTLSMLVGAHYGHDPAECIVPDTYSPILSRQALQRWHAQDRASCGIADCGHVTGQKVCSAQTPDPNNPVEKQWNEELVTINGPWDAVFMQPGDYVELDVGTAPVSHYCEVTRPVPVPLQLNASQGRGSMPRAAQKRALVAVLVASQASMNNASWQAWSRYAAGLGQCWCASKHAVHVILPMSCLARCRSGGGHQHKRLGQCCGGGRPGTPIVLLYLQPAACTCFLFTLASQNAIKDTKVRLCISLAALARRVVIRQPWCIACTAIDVPACTRVMWNPWEAMKDSYEHFCCVENGKISSPVVLQPGSSWRATQELNVVDLETPEALAE